MSTKVCTECNMTIPLDAQHYDRDRHSADGFRDVCKMCRKEQRETPKKSPSETMRSIEDEAMDALGKIDPTQAETISVPHMAELFEAIMTAFQGTQGFARHVMHTFLSAKPGSAVKQKILSDIIKLGQKTTETGLAQVSMDKLTTEELDELHKRIAGQIVSERKLAKKASVPVIQEIGRAHV